MKISRILLGGYLVVATIAGAAQAQPAQDPATADNPPNAGAKPQTPEDQQKTMEEAMKKGQEQGLAMMKMSPDERSAALHKMMEQAFRAQLTGAGFKDPKLQDILVNFVNAQEQQRTDVRKEGQKLFKAMQAGADGPNLNILTSNYLGAVEDAKAARDADCKELDDEISYTTQPKLVALLTVLGFVGDAAYYTGDMTMIGNMSIASLAGVFSTPPAAKPAGAAPAPPAAPAVQN